MSQFTPHQQQALTVVAEWLRSSWLERRAAGLPSVRLCRHRQDHACPPHRRRGRRRGEIRCLHRQGGDGDARQRLPRRLHHPQPHLPRARERRGDPEFDLWDEAPASKAELIIIDECSMVDAELGRDLISFGVPVLVLGDPRSCRRSRAAAFSPRPSQTRCSPKCTGRRRTIRSCGCRWTSAPVNTSSRATTVKPMCCAKPDLDPQRVLEADQVLVGRNATRRSDNTRMRERRGFDDPMPLGRGQAGVPAQQPQERTCSTVASGR